MNKSIDPDVINPIDYFNNNHIQYMLNILCSKPLAEITSINSFSYTKNREDKKKKMIIMEDNMFIAKMPNDLGMIVNEKYSPFRMLVEFQFKNNWQKAIWFIVYDLMNCPTPYIRVATKYFKIIKKVDRNGISRTELKIWDKLTIIDDYSRNFLNRIPSYNDFTIEPNNKNYNTIIGNNYNLYAPFEHKIIEKELYEENKWKWTKILLNHIFGEQYEIGLMYVKSLYDLPKQKLPIFVLVSEERETGKTTFMDWIELLFGDNTVIINPQDIANSFNSSYADKNIIMIEESRFESVQATEKLKNLATQKKILVNTKFIQQYSIPFHGHLIISSNDENKFSRVDNSEIRYWVRQIPTLKGKANHNILNDLREEIPYFLYYLNTLPDIDTTKSRMVFEAEILNTAALNRVKKESLPSLHKEIILLLDAHCSENKDIKEFTFIAKDIKNKWFKHNHKIEINWIDKILKDSIKLSRLNMCRFIPLEEESFKVVKKSGRPFIYKNKYYGTEIEESSINTKELFTTTIESIEPIESNGSIL
jgi:hypothetical protein